MRNYIFLNFLLLLFSFLFIVPNSFAVCTPFSLTIPNVTINWDESFKKSTQTMTATKTATSQACDFFVTFSKGGTPGTYDDRRMVRSGGSEELRYQLHKDKALSSGKILKEFPEADVPDEVVVGKVKKNKTSKNVKYYIDIPEDLATTPTLVKDGTYTDTYVAKIYSGIVDDNPPATADDTVNVTITTIVPKIIRISLRNTSQSFREQDTDQTVNFNNLSEGENKSFKLMVVSNAGYSVTFSSLNNGVMKNAAPSSLTDVSYILKVDSITKDLSNSASSPVVVATGSGQSSTDGVEHPVYVEVGSVANKLAGDYSDTITVTATTTE